MTGQCAIVTGSARRIGREIVRHLAREGWEIALHYRTSEADATALQAELSAAGTKCRIYRADMREPEQLETLILRVFEDFDTPKLLVNSASIFERDRVTNMRVETWYDHMAINTLAPTLLTKHFCEHGEPGKCVINMLDQKVGFPSPDFFSYTVSKTALATITRLLAMEYHGRCRVNGIAPGLTLPSGPQSVEEFQKSFNDTPLGVGPTIEEICRAVTLFATSAAITGEIITIDGGRHLMKPAPPFVDLPLG